MEIKKSDGTTRTERLLADLCEKTFLKAPFPIPLSREEITVHKIVVAHGATEACKNWSGDNVSGSLAVVYGDADESPEFPFLIDLDKDDPVHVFDSHTLPIVLGELDTVFDFATYLDEKVRAIRSLQMLAYAGEEDLLANYFLNFDKKRNRHFVGTDDPTLTGVMIGEGEWQSFICHDA